MMARFDDMLIQQLLSSALPLNGGPNEHPHPTPNEAPNGGQANGVQLPEQVNLQHPVVHKETSPPSQVLPHPQNFIPPNGVPPP